MRVRCREDSETAEKGARSKRHYTTMAAKTTEGSLESLGPNLPMQEGNALDGNCDSETNASLDQIESWPGKGTWHRRRNGNLPLSLSRRNWTAHLQNSQLTEWHEAPEAD